MQVSPCGLECGLPMLCPGGTSAITFLHDQRFPGQILFCYSLAPAETAKDIKIQSFLAVWLCSFIFTKCVQFS